MIPFRKTLAFRLLVLSFILLALPLLVDAFIVVQNSYRDAINDAKGRLLEAARSKEAVLGQAEPVKLSFLLTVENFLNLPNQFPKTPKASLDDTLFKISEIGEIEGMLLLDITPEHRYIVIGGSNPAYIGWDYTELLKLANIHSPESARRGYFTYFYYNTKNLEPIFMVGRVVVSEKDETPVGVILVYQKINKILDSLLQSKKDHYTTNFALLFPATIVFASSDPKLQYKYFEPVPQDILDILKYQEPFAKLLLPNEPLKTSYGIGFPFFEFMWQGKKQIGYMRQQPNVNYMVLSYASKSDIYASTFQRFLQIFIIFLAILLIGGFLSFLLTKILSKPMENLSRVMIGIQKDLSLRYQFHTLGFEINLLGNIFNEMIDTLLQKKQIAEEERIKAETLAKELLIGQEVQKSLLPPYLVDFPEVDVASVYIPAKDVGGDFYSAFVREGKDELVLSIADAAGKGVQACFYSLGVRSLLRSFIKEYDDVAHVMQEVNTLFCLDTKDTGMFVTVLMGFYDRKTKTLSYYSCGHNPGMIRKKDGTIEMLKNKDIAMGVMPLSKKKPDSIPLEKGDYVVFYTDGITEAHNEKFEEFGENRLKEYLKGIDGKTAKEVAEALVQELNVFVGKAPQHDDITILIMRVV